jgi:hypothetical protein
MADRKPLILIEALSFLCSYWSILQDDTYDQE